MLSLKHTLPRAIAPLTRPTVVVSRHLIVTANNKSDEKPSSSFDGILSVFEANKNETGKDNLSNALNESAKKQKSQSAINSSASEDIFNISLIGSLATVGQTPHQLYINASPNNTIITLTKPNGAPLITTSGGSAGFKKAARSGYEAAHQAALQLLDKKEAKNLQVANLHIVLKGFGPGRDAAFKALVGGAQWNVKRITDATPVPFGGCRPKKARRL
ncbi:translational machinery component [Backusella circina FSU 941]|nr:translational machinery component [Backusella circina FSU 941]